MTDLPHHTGTGPQSDREKPQQAAETPKPTFDPSTFALEEYKSIHAKINQLRDTVGKLETFTIGGTVVAVGILLGIGHTKSDYASGWLSLFACWALVLIVLAATMRCWSYYIYIGHLRKYGMQIEREMKDAGYKLDGVEIYSEGKWLTLLYIAMLLISVVLVGAVLLLAILKSLGFAIP